MQVRGTISKIINCLVQLSVRLSKVAGRRCCVNIDAYVIAASAESATAPSLALVAMGVAPAALLVTSLLVGRFRTLRRRAEGAARHHRTTTAQRPIAVAPPPRPANPYELDRPPLGQVAMVLRGAARVLDLSGSGVPRIAYEPEAVIARAMLLVDCLEPARSPRSWVRAQPQRALLAS
jgi:hypothetical protein